MKKLSSALLGIAVGAAVGFVIDYLFGPAHDTRFDESYQSRLDRALSEGRRAALEREAELRHQLANAQGKQLTG